MRASKLLVAVLLVPLAGCLAETPTVDHASQEAARTTEQIRAEVVAALSGIPCEATVGSTTQNSGNLALLSAVSLPVEQEGTIHAEIDIGGDLAVHARYSTSGFEIYDVRDPLHPVHLGNWTHRAADGEEIQDGALDVKFTPDNQTVLVGAGDGILMVDVRDPTAPSLVGEWHVTEGMPLGGDLASYNPHMLYSATIDGQDWVFLAPNSNTGAWILKLTGTPDARKLEYVTNTLPVEGGPLGPHDIYVQQDTMDGHWYLYSADGFHGWTVFEIDDPTHPLPPRGWVNPAELAYTHTMQAQEINGKRIVATIAEVGVNFLRVYDATNLLAPILLGQWQAEPGSGSTNPEHNLNIVDGKLYFAYYSFGMYVFDLAKATSGPSLPLAGTVSLAPVAHWSVGTEPTRGPTAFEGFWDVVLKDGIVYVSHIEGGLLVLGYGCNGYEPRLTSTG